MIECEATGRTLDEAVEKALTSLGIKRENSSAVARKKPFSPSRIFRAPVKPCLASRADNRPFMAALPGCRCFVIAPSVRNSHNPAACDPALPKALTVSSRPRNNIFAAAIHRPP